MLRKNLLLLGLLVVGVLFTGCPKEAEEPEEPEYVFEPAPLPKVSFNISNAKALGGRDASSSRAVSGARAATDNSNGSILVKIMEDGTLESALSCQVSDIENFSEEEKLGMTHYAKLTDVFLPPKDSDCNDVYLLFDGQTYFPAQEQEEPYFIDYWCLSQLICIHDDNSWTDILYDDPINSPIYPIDSKKNIQVASDGSLFILFREAGGWEHYIRKYDPKTKTVSELCRFGRPAPLTEEIENLTDEELLKTDVKVKKLKVSKDGKWAYIQVFTFDKNYIHVISTEDPSVFTDIEVGSTPCWDYDEESNQLYYLSDKESTTKLYKVDYNGQNEKLLKEKILYCNDLMVVAKDTIWLRNYESDGTPGTMVCFYEIKINNDQASDPVEVKSAKVQEGDIVGYNCQEYYIIKDNAVYLWYAADRFNYQPYELCYKYNEIIRFPFTDDPVVLYRDILPEQNNIIMSSWNVGNEKLYITGWDHDDKPVNYAINLDGTGEAEPVAEGQVFTCIGSLK